MTRYNASAWALARKMFQYEDDGRIWSNGRLARELGKMGCSLISDDEKAAYYDRALDILEKKTCPPGLKVGSDQPISLATL